MKRVWNKLKRHKVTKTELLHLEVLQLFLEGVLATAFVMGEKIVSAVVIAIAGSGKTEIMKKYECNEGVVACDKFTAFGIQQSFLPQIKSGEIHHLMMYDMERLRSYSSHTVKSLVGALSMLIEDGRWSVADYASKELHVTNLNCGFIGGITPDTWSNGRLTFLTPTFKSRLLPFTFGYSKKAITDIQDSIELGEYIKKRVSDIHLNLPDKPIHVKLPRQHARAVRKISELLVKDDPRLRPMRPHKMLRTLVKAFALLDGRKKVEMGDVGKLYKLLKWMNYKFNPIG